MSFKADQDDFIYVLEPGEVNVPKPIAAAPTFQDKWVKNATDKFSSPELFAANTLKELYPQHSLVMTQNLSLSTLYQPFIDIKPIPSSDVFANLTFRAIPRRSGGSVPGQLIEKVVFGGYDVTWKGYRFVVYVMTWMQGNSVRTQSYILYQGTDQPAKDFLLSIGVFRDQLHDEIWVFNQGFWSKNSQLFFEIQKSDWKDVVLKDDFEKSLKKDIYGFFESEDIYKELSIPWKRGVILHGPPGNGKTITIKVIMKTCFDKGFLPLYVKSFQSYKGEEGAMQDVFEKARQLSPCVMILEDLDSLINDRNRSFFLNQLDGLEGNDGILVIGSTNHFDRLDPALSSRPSRFDRKYLFDDPDREARVLYTRYWQNKLRSNKDVAFSDTLVTEIADLTDRFSYAYLKEVFVSSLVLLATNEENEKPEFSKLVKAQIISLREQLNKDRRVLPAVTSVQHGCYVARAGVPQPVFQSQLEHEEEIELVKHRTNRINRNSDETKRREQEFMIWNRASASANHPQILHAIASRSPSGSAKDEDDKTWAAVDKTDVSSAADKPAVHPTRLPTAVTLSKFPWSIPVSHLSSPPLPQLTIKAQPVLPTSHADAPPLNLPAENFVAEPGASTLFTPPLAPPERADEQSPSILSAPTMPGSLLTGNLPIPGRWYNPTTPGGKEPFQF